MPGNEIIHSECKGAGSVAGTDSSPTTWPVINRSIATEANRVV